MNLASAIATIAGTYYVVGFFQTILHRLLGHWLHAGLIYRIHVFSHHRIYSGRNLRADSYSEKEKDVSYTYLFPAIAVAAAAYLLLPLDLFALHLATLACASLLHVYIHIHYHLKDTWLSRFEWFTQRRRLHFIHHRDNTKNFALLEFWFDRLLGTFADVAAKR
jgi:sterol desaturase/sphingolipid hydroxylase (fatty acid hydroxylase superfamily)